MAWNVGVAGCGVAGLAVATLLARQGHRVTIHEQARVLGRVGAGVLLQPSGQMILREMGLLDETVAEAERIERLTAFTHRGGKLIDLPYAEKAGDPCAYGIQRGALFVVLHRAALAAGVTVETGRRVVRYTAEKGRARFLDATGKSVGPYDFVLAADGARSALRETTQIPARVRPYPHGALWLVGPCTSIQQRLLQVSRGTRELCGILPTGGGRASLFWSVRNDDVYALRQRGYSSWCDDVMGLAPDAREILATANDFEAVRFTSYMRVHMPRPYDGVCLFLGDAAHAMSPHLGQGINLALIDAYVFAEALAACGNFSRACEQFTRQRAAHLRAYRIITFLLSPFFQSRGVIKGWGRDVCLPLMPKVGFLRRQMVMTMGGCRGSLLGGRWRISDTPSSRAAAAALQK
jgi:2-polyprenyl-6-methoxyphenol hydroxylase-like FAD-dependent oxidoreductase